MCLCGRVCGGEEVMYRIIEYESEWSVVLVCEGVWRRGTVLVRPQDGQEVVWYELLQYLCVV